MSTPKKLTSLEIIKEIQPILQQENMELTILGESNDLVKIGIHRTGPGSPVAFMVKAIEGTFKKYHSSINKVELASYEPNDHAAIASDLTEKILHPETSGVAMKVQGNPILDLSDQNQKDSLSALEAFLRMWSQSVSILGVAGISETGPSNAIKKWSTHFEKAYDTIIPDPENSNLVWITLNDTTVLEDRLKDNEVFPAKAYL